MRTTDRTRLRAALATPAFLLGLLLASTWLEARCSADARPEAPAPVDGAEAGPLVPDA